MAAAFARFAGGGAGSGRLRRLTYTGMRRDVEHMGLRVWALGIRVLW